MHRQKLKWGGNAMKKVEITKSCSGIRFAFQQGEVVDIDDRLADDLIRAKFAVAVDIEETADSESVNVETTAEDEKKPVRRRRATKKDVQDNVGE